METKLEAMEMWAWRRMLKISWTERKSNETVLNMVGEQRKLMKTIRKRQMRFLGHTIRRGGIENVAITGMIEGKRGRGRPREKYLDGLARAIGGNITPTRILQKTRDRQRWRIMTANVLENTAHR